MTTRRVAWLLIAVLALAGVTVCMTHGPELWTSIAYVEEESILPFRYLRARTRWAPGPKYIVPPQLCPWCRRGEHSWCSLRNFEHRADKIKVYEANDIFSCRNLELAEAAIDQLQCTCPEALHKWCRPCESGTHRHPPAYMKRNLDCACPDPTHRRR